MDAFPPRASDFQPRPAAIETIGKRFDDLLCGPGGGQMLGDIEMHHTSAMMSKYDQDK
jgi:hypothetical protein